MPYVKQNLRPRLNLVVESLRLANLKVDGDLNYILFKYCKDEVDKRYNSLKNYCAELRACATEIERTILAQREDEARKENGDV